MKIWFREHIEEIFLFCCLLTVISMFIFRFGCFASDVDWLSQHSVFPDYFRKLFYKTGKLIPSFAANIGGGQNIFHFSYYGLLSPLILPSYLLPFMKMDMYLSIVSVLCILASVILLYRWLCAKGFRGKLSCSMATVYLFATPVLFQSYTQWMFVNYMPFLILAFIGVDRFMEKKKPLVMCISIFLMIMTSYYFSIGGMFALALYQIAYAVKKEEGHFKWSNFLLKEFEIAVYVILSLLMSCVLLVPTFFTLLGRSSDSKNVVTLSELLIPQIKWSHLVYSGYGLGLTTLAITAVIAALFYKKAWERVLGYGLIVVLFVPLFEYLLNGGLYFRGKVFIPFIPLLLYWMAYFLMKIHDRKISARLVSFCFGITIFLAAMCEGDSELLFRQYVIFDAILMFFAHLLYEKVRKMACIIVPVFLLLGVFSVAFHATQKNMVPDHLFAKVESETYSDAIAELKRGDNQGYRIETRGNDKENSVNINRIYDINQSISSIYSSAYAARYDAFRKEVFGVNEPHRNILMQGMTNNQIFLKLMGVKYLISDQKLNAKILERTPEYSIYDNGEVAPLGYATNHTLSGKRFESLAFPYNQIAFLHGIVTDDASMTSEQKDLAVLSMLKREVCVAPFSIGTVNSKKLTIEERQDGYRIVSKGSATVRAKIAQENVKHANYIFVEFTVKNNKKKKDMSIRIENEKNKLTDVTHVYYNKNKHFRYAVSCDKIKDINIIFGQGDYEITNIKCYVANINDAGIADLYRNKMDITDDWSDGDNLEGQIECADNAKFVTSIPNADGFTLYVDGKKTKIENVNYAFLGATLDKGFHRIRISYESPGLRTGKMLSVVGFVLYMILCVLRGRAYMKRRRYIEEEGGKE